MLADRITPAALKLAMSRVAVPVIVEARPGQLLGLLEEAAQYAEEVRPGVLRAVLPIEHSLFFPEMVAPRFNMFSAILPREVVFDLAEDKRVERIYPNRLKWALSYPRVSAEGVYTMLRGRARKRAEFTSTYWTKRAIGADVANAKGFTGRGVKVAVLDTGCSVTHEQLSGRVKVRSVFRAQKADSNGHGTWCCACVGGRVSQDDALSRLAGKTVLCEGMAPEAELLSVKCLGYVVGCGADSDIIKAVELAIESGAKVVSMSLGGRVEDESQEDDPYFKVMAAAVGAGVIPVVAAGNDGPNPRTINTPGWIESVLTVGAYDPITGRVAEYSSRGPTADDRVKPDVVAPGGGVPDHGIDSAIVNLLDTSGDGVVNRYSPIQGTSMATPHVAGLLACAAQAWRDLLGKELTVEEVKMIAEKLADHEKSHDAGWGALTWWKIEEWLETEYGTRV